MQVEKYIFDAILDDVLLIKTVPTMSVTKNLGLNRSVSFLWHKKAV